MSLSSAQIKAALPKLIRRDIELNGLAAFFRHFWSTIEPAKFVSSWHVDAIADHLEACQRREITDLVINVPPGAGKTNLVSSLWPAFVWVLEPEARFITATYSDRLSARHAERQRQVCGSDLFARTFPGFDRGGMLSDPVRHFSNGAGGFRFSTTIGGAATGNHAHFHIADDPNKAQDANATAISPKALEEVLSWWDSTMATRRIPGQELVRVIVMQRLHAKDLAGVCLDRGYAHLCIPARYEPNATWDRGSPLPRRDPRTEPGEIFWPLVTEAEMQKKEADLVTPSAVSSQLQQNPNPEKGGIIEREWLRTWEELPAPPRAMRFVQVWDFAAKSTTPAHSRTHGALWACFGKDFFLIDEVIGHWNYPLAKKVFLACQTNLDLDPLVRRGMLTKQDAHAIGEIRAELRHPEMWKCALLPRVEEKANGITLLQDLSNVVRCKGTEPKGSKEDRITVHSDKFEAGHVFLPTKDWLDTVPDFINELVYFPRWGHDDRVDTTSEALDALTDRYSRIKAALE